MEHKDRFGTSDAAEVKIIKTGKLLHDLPKQSMLLLAPT